MKSLVLISAFLTVAQFHVMAQLELSSENMDYSFSDQYYFWQDGFEADPGPSGDGVVWNFSELDFEQVYSALYDPPEDTNYGDDFTEAQLAVTDNLSFFDYYELTDENLLSWGYARFNIFANVVKEVLEDPRELMSFPFAYGDTHYDEFSGEFTADDDLFGISTFDRTGSIEAEVDGTGDVVLNYGVVQDCIRIKYEITITDSLPEAGFGIEFQVTEYRWYKPGYHFPVMAITLSQDVFFGLISTNYETLFLGHTSIPWTTDVEENDTEENFFAWYDSSADQLKSNMSLSDIEQINGYDSNGRLVYSQNQVLDNRSIPLVLKPGVYIFQFTLKKVIRFIEK